MRRKSDTHGDSRTGRGRRTRDRLLTGEPPLEQVLAADASSSGLCNQLFLLGDEMREAALGVARIESFLVEVQTLLGTSGLSADDVEAVLARDNTADHLDQLEDALSGLRRSLRQAHAELARARPAASEPASASEPRWLAHQAQ